MENDELTTQAISEVALFLQRYSPAEQEKLMAMVDELFANQEFLIHEEDVLLALYDVERIYAELEKSDVFEALSTKQKAAYRDTRNRLHALIRDLEQDSTQEQLAS